MNEVFALEATSVRWCQFVSLLFLTSYVWLKIKIRKLDDPIQDNGDDSSDPDYDQQWR